MPGANDNNHNNPFKVSCTNLEVKSEINFYMRAVLPFVESLIYSLKENHFSDDPEALLLCLEEMINSQNPFSDEKFRPSLESQGINPTIGVQQSLQITWKNYWNLRLENEISHDTKKLILNQLKLAICYYAYLLLPQPLTRRWHKIVEAAPQMVRAATRHLSTAYQPRDSRLFFTVNSRRTPYCLLASLFIVFSTIGSLLLFSQNFTSEEEHSSRDDNPTRQALGVIIIFLASACCILPSVYCCHQFHAERRERRPLDHNEDDVEAENRTTLNP